jgi:PAS domain S-box-containing protein
MPDDRHPLATLPPAAQAIMEAAPDAMVVTDRQGRIVFANAQVDRLFGFPRQELIGHSVEILIPERFRPTHPDHRNRYFLDARARPMGAGRLELFGLRKDGTEFPAEISLSPLESEDGMLAITAIRDASDRKKVEAKFRGLVEAAPDAIVITDQRGRIVLLNAQAERLFGYRREEVLGELVEALVPKRYRPRHPAYRNDYFREPKTRAMGAAGVELYGVRKDGSEFPAEISLSPLETEEGTLALTAIRDTTERKKTEVERIRFAQAQEAVRMRDEFISIAAHELRTPLTSVQLHLQGLQDTLKRAAGDGGRLDAPKLQTKVEKAVQQTVRLADLVNALLDVSRVIGGRLTLNLDRTDLVRVAQDVVEHFRESASRVGSEIAIRAPAEPVLGLWDRFRLEQVLTNLLSNAVKYGSGKPIEVRVWRDGEMASVSVRDEGIGIAPTDAERIFDKFERAAPMTQYGGLGLGLYISRSLVAAHGGRIRVDSSAGNGATFTVELPPQPPLTEPAAMPASGERTA